MSLPQARINYLTGEQKWEKESSRAWSSTHQSQAQGWQFLLRMAGGDGNVIRVGQAAGFSFLQNCVECLSGACPQPAWL